MRRIFHSTALLVLWSMTSVGFCFSSNCIAQENNDDKTISLKVRVVDSNNQPIANATAVALAACAIDSEQFPVQPSDSSGYLLATNLPTKNAYRLLITHDDQIAFSRANHNLATGVIELPDVVFSGWRTITGRVTSNSDEPLAGVRVFQQGDSHQLNETVTDQKGRFELKRFPGHAAVVFFEHSNYWFTGKVLPADENRVEKKITSRDQENPEQWEADFALPVLSSEDPWFQRIRETAIKAASEELNQLTEKQIQKLLTDRPTSFFMRQLGMLSPHWQQQFMTNSNSNQADRFFPVLFDYQGTDNQAALAWTFSSESLNDRTNGLMTTSDILQRDTHVSAEAMAEQKRILNRQAITLIPEVRQASPEIAIGGITQIATVLFQNGETNLATRLTNEAVERLASTDSANKNNLIFSVAEVLVEIGEIDQAVKLAEQIKETYFPILLAYDIAAHDPHRAWEIAKDFEFRIGQGSALSATYGLPLLCALAARKDPQLAIKFVNLCDKCPIRGEPMPAFEGASKQLAHHANEAPRRMLQAKLKAIIANEIVESNPDLARELFTEAVDAITTEQYAVRNPVGGFVKEPSEYIASFLVDIAKLDTGWAAEIAWRAAAIRKSPHLNCNEFFNTNHSVESTCLTQLDANAFQLCDPMLQRMIDESWSGAGVSIQYLRLGALSPEQCLEFAKRLCPKANPNGISARTTALVNLANDLQNRDNPLLKASLGGMLKQIINSELWIRVPE